MWLSLAKIRTCSKVTGFFASLITNPVGEAFDHWVFAFNYLSNGLTVLANTLPAAPDGATNKRSVGLGCGAGSAGVSRREASSLRAVAARRAERYM